MSVTLSLCRRPLSHVFFRWRIYNIHMQFDIFQFWWLFMHKPNNCIDWSRVVYLWQLSYVQWRQWVIKRCRDSFWWYYLVNCRNRARIMIHFVTWYGTWFSRKISPTWKKQGDGIDVGVNFGLFAVCLILHRST